MVRSILFFIIVGIVFGFSTKTYGLDNLMLYGIVKEVHPEKKEITIDVKTDSCRGERVFKYSVDKEKEDVIDQLVGKEVMFTLDSSRCEEGKKNTIFFTPRKGVEPWER
ncbi:MAG: hypothetical protein GXO99_00925 [Nitrospirae bacterium]|nr:hypothetical protein [Nitrospirota bacterium]